MHYSVGRRGDQWVVSVHGLELLCCKQRKMAIRIVRHATICLMKWQPRDMEQEIFEIAPVTPVASNKTNPAICEVSPIGAAN
jgi:hypothetical protein